MRFVPIIVLIGTGFGLTLAYAAPPAVVSGAAGNAAGGMARAYEATKQFLAQGGRKAPTFGGDAPVFRYAAIQRGSIEQTVTVTGALQPVKTIEVGSQLSGQLARVYVDFNDTVSKDQPLALIDPRSFAARVDEARASVAVANSLVDIARAKLDRARIDLQNARGSRDVLAAKLESAQAVKTSAQKTLQRKLALQSQNVVATTTVDDAQTEFTARLAQEREAEVLMSLNAYSVDGAQADVRRIEAELQQARMAVPEKAAVLAAAQADLDRTVIRSPIDGVVVGRFVNEGQTLAVGLESRTTFVVAHRLEDMEIHAQVDEADIGRIVPRQRAHFTVDAYPDRRFEAVVRQVRKAPQNQQHVVTYTVVLSTSNLDGALLPGMTALVKIVIERQDDVLKVPLAALRFQPSGTRPDSTAERSGVWVLTASGSLHRIAVTVGAAGTEQVALKSGDLVEGSQVAVGQAIRPAGMEFLGIRFGS
ncbi:efflux RND transporter periplasmic adaptor subunit [Bradyrhizobium betae]|uniref:Efflux RND transporter periplasmic adaptor subunit n=1 Tax=Bradyrhizobium betae TaxID=244734 RepID=A0A5P6PEC1_9BRAD|nr:efflux RND transporter periplasmic adaptor subunit [Bradyrhizobium betae]MCS3730715.1 HlyD family secretion protein [Bradyrhizobium betae]QFI76224.1 efflux RND transporter periplasmic adaptor subunit [Bradyrhizobium betae]